MCCYSELTSYHNPTRRNKHNKRPRSSLPAQSVHMKKSRVSPIPSIAYDVFMSFVSYYESNGETYCDASKILGTECYQAWLNTRTKPSSFPADVFRRTVVAHLTGTKKRKPFPKAVEASLLKAVRVKQVWPCFVNILDKNGSPVVFGNTGFRPRGYHESTETHGVSPFLPVSPTSSIHHETGFHNIEAVVRMEKLQEPDCFGQEIAPFQVPREEMQAINFFFDLPTFE
uniref:Uncharacterized protein n=1 Tax=Mucochytrium quahogii TaxID=96639 RepID=A0A7S2RLH0_9STRA|mmetsp:Transcript_16782/g.36519  ORF Transcript_16782/g.36519 Transcript_16782/m.36519 type:complete len:228 (+) Transcript_16782:1086-1769(+)